MEINAEVDHVAFVTDNTGATVDFYSRVLGWPIVGAERGREPDGPEWFITAFQGPGLTVAFEEVEGRAAPRYEVVGYPHVGLDAGSDDAYQSWKDHLDRCGVKYLEIGERELFFRDPNRVTFQVLRRRSTQGPRERDAAGQMVKQWVADHPQGAPDPT